MHHQAIRNNLITVIELMGLPGVGKSSVSKELEKFDFKLVIPRNELKATHLFKNFSLLKKTIRLMKFSLIKRNNRKYRLIKIAIIQERAKQCRKNIVVDEGVIHESFKALMQDEGALNFIISNILSYSATNVIYLVDDHKSIMKKLKQKREFGFVSKILSRNDNLVKEWEKAQSVLNLLEKELLNNHKKITKISCHKKTTIEICHEIIMSL